MFFFAHVFLSVPVDQNKNSNFKMPNPSKAPLNYLISLFILYTTMNKPYWNLDVVI
jgi:hypothetical protein